MWKGLFLSKTTVCCSLPDLGGMEYSWNSSQWVDVDSPSKGQGWNDGRDINESVIPQLDGPVDEKSDTGKLCST